MSDPFGGFPLRPDTEDFWRLSEIILYLDGEFAEGKADFEEFVGKEIDVNSLGYMALQRSLRSGGDKSRDILVAETSGYIEAFLVGRLYERKYGKVSK